MKDQKSLVVILVLSLVVLISTSSLAFVLFFKEESKETVSKNDSSQEESNNSDEIEELVDFEEEAELEIDALNPEDDSSILFTTASTCSEFETSDTFDNNTLTNLVKRANGTYQVSNGKLNLIKSADTKDNNTIIPSTAPAIYSTYTDITGEVEISTHVINFTEPSKIESGLKKSGGSIVMSAVRLRMFSKNLSEGVLIYDLYKKTDGKIYLRVGRSVKGNYKVLAIKNVTKKMEGEKSAQLTLIRKKEGNKFKVTPSVKFLAQDGVTVTDEITLKPRALSGKLKFVGVVHRGNWQTKQTQAVLESVKIKGCGTKVSSDQMNYLLDEDEGNANNSEDQYGE